LDRYDSVLDAYVQSSLGRKRWFLHNRGGAAIEDDQDEMSFLQQQFLMRAYKEYGQTKENMPASARKHL
jgi:hypothetical protein